MSLAVMHSLQSWESSSPMSMSLVGSHCFDFLTFSVHLGWSLRQVRTHLEASVNEDRDPVQSSSCAVASVSSSSGVVVVSNLERRLVP